CLLYTMINGTLKAGDLQSARELYNTMLQMGLPPDALTYSTLIHRFLRFGLLSDAKSVYQKMVASGHKPNACVYDSLLKGFSSQGETEEVFDLIHEMADKGVHLDQELTSTILICLCNISEDLDVAKLFPTFSQETSKGKSISCKDLLLKLQECHPELRLHAA
ncbi:hypothetical protein CICLE_v100144561mg, partial [Citrus x clementina]